MSIIYADSTASGENNGTSWTDAYTSLTSTDRTAVAASAISQFSAHSTGGPVV